MDVGWRWREKVAASGSGTPSRESSSARSFALPGPPGPSDAQLANRLGARLRPGRSARRGGGGGRGADLGLGRRELLRPPLRLPASVLGLAFSPDGSQLAIPFGAFSGEGPNGVEILDVGSGERVARLSTDGEVGSVAFSPTAACSRVARSTAARSSGRPTAGGGWDVRSLAEHVVHSPSGVLTGRAHTCDLTLGPLGGALGRRLAGADRAPPAATTGEPGGEISVTARFTPDGARLFVASGARARSAGRSIPPPGGRQGLPADGRRPYARRVGGDRSGARLHRGLPLRLTADRLAPQTAPARE